MPERDFPKIRFFLEVLDNDALALSKMLEQILAEVTEPGIQAEIERLRELVVIDRNDLDVLVNLLRQVIEDQGEVQIAPPDAPPASLVDFLSPGDHGDRYIESDDDDYPSGQPPLVLDLEERDSAEDPPLIHQDNHTEDVVALFNQGYVGAVLGEAAACSEAPR